MGFGWPTLYWQLDPANVPGGIEAYDRAVKEASDEYKTHAVIPSISFFFFNSKLMKVLITVLNYIASGHFFSRIC